MLGLLNKTNTMVALRVQHFIECHLPWHFLYVCPSHTVRDHCDWLRESVAERAEPLALRNDAKLLIN